MKQFLKKAHLTIVQLFHTYGYQIYPVGGCVRDFYMQRSPQDIDFATNATPMQMKQMLTKEQICFHTQGEQFGTILIVYQDTPMEVTTFRKESSYYDQRHCNVTFIQDLKEDLRRRDFTMNAMAYDLYQNRIIDYFDGRKHIDQKQIHAVGNLPTRIQEDALRVLRGFRFALRFHFSFSKEDLAYLYTTLEDGILNHIAKERIHQEMMKILALPYLTQTDLALVLPLFRKALNLPLTNEVIELLPLMMEYSKLLSYQSQDLTLLRLCLLYSSYTPVSSLPNNYLLLTNKQKKTLLKWRVALTMPLSCDKVELHQLLEQLPNQNYHEFMILKLTLAKRQNQSIDELLHIDSLLEEMKQSQCIYTLKTLAINGHDLIETFALSPSPMISQMLEKALDEVRKENLPNKKEALLSYLKKHFFL